jgi:hypothetical protein
MITDHGWVKADWAINVANWPMPLHNASLAKYARSPVVARRHQSGAAHACAILQIFAGLVLTPPRIGPASLLGERVQQESRDKLDREHVAGFAGAFGAAAMWSVAGLRSLARRAFHIESVRIDPRSFVHHRPGWDVIVMWSGPRFAALEPPGRNQGRCGVSNQARQSTWFVVSQVALFWCC